MAVTYRIEPGERIVYLITIGESNFADWKDAMLAALSDPAFERGMGFLSDRSSQTDVPDSEFVKSNVTFLRQHSDELKGCKWAAVSNNKAAFGMHRMFSILSEPTGVTMRAFMDQESARRWLLDL